MFTNSTHQTDITTHFTYVCLLNKHPRHSVSTGLFTFVYIDSHVTVTYHEVAKIFIRLGSMLPELLDNINLFVRMPLNNNLQNIRLFA